MKRVYIQLLIIFCLFVQSVSAGPSETIDVDVKAFSSATALWSFMPAIAKETLSRYEGHGARSLDKLLKLQLAVGDNSGALASINRLRRLLAVNHAPHANVHDTEYEIYARANIVATARRQPFGTAFRDAFRSKFDSFSDLDAFEVAFVLSRPMARAQSDLQDELDKLRGKSQISVDDGVELVNAYQADRFYASIAPEIGSLMRSDANRRYVIDDRKLIHTPNGATISAIVVRKRGVTVPQSAALEFTIYATPASDIRYTEYAAARGYVGVTAYTRGKGYSTNKIVPYEYDGIDAAGVIDWISKQPWSNGKVGMYGGSYDGFTQWAAAKRVPPALKTIAPIAANNPGNGLPMENNIFLLVNYPWAFYVTDNKFTDDGAYSNAHRRQINDLWYASGRSYRDVDKLDGTPNPWLRKWLQHPGYDAYWQAMLPYRDEFANINIPVLTISGYYDDGQASALNFLKDHHRYNPRAVDYLVIGPYDHLGSQRSVKDQVLRGYPIDSVAQFDTPDLTFQWFDYIMKGAKKPALLQNRINYEVMGANLWRHAPSVEQMSNGRLMLYLSNERVGKRYYALAKKAPTHVGLLEQQVDFADRKTTNNDYYPSPILGKQPDISNGYAFLSAPFERATEIDGFFSGVIQAIINKRDFDLGLVLYEMRRDGKLMELSYFTGRASYARDMTNRHLLTPGKIETIVFDRSQLVSRRLSKGSRLLLTLNVNRNQFAQINYGTGRDVSDESIRDAKTRLQIKWLTTSNVSIPVYR